ncbi:MAG: hypothetical protein E7021_04975 [Alphaproteobacteria bacterium]|nr:hypothetical protein [Alphaproteobacteria bacterium]
MSSFYAEPPKTKREQEREEARQKRQDDKRHKKERKEIERKALEGVMSLYGCSKEEAKKLINEIFNEWAKQFRKAIKEENAKLRRRPISKNMTSQTLAKRREGR